MINGWTVIPNHDLKRQNMTDDRTLLSMGKHKPVATPRGMHRQLPTYGVGRGGGCARPYPN